jgi:hypothetical protein
MGRRCAWLLLVMVGCVLLFVSVFPVFAYIRFQEPWQTALVASKLIMLPVGAFCLLGAAALKLRKARP